MNRTRAKIFGLILCVALLISMVPAQAAAQGESYVSKEQAVSTILNTVGLGALSENESDLTAFSDVSRINPEYTDEMAIAVTNGILLGSPDKILNPQKNITRLEFAIMLSRTIRELPVIKSGEALSDIPAEYRGHVNRLVSAGLLNGYGNGTFGAGDYLTQGQLNSVMTRISGLSSTRVQDDFYYTVNQDWLASARLPAGYPGLGSFDEVDMNNRAKLGIIAQDLLKIRGSYIEGTKEQKMADFYTSILDIENRDKEGIEPITEYLVQFEGVKSIGELLTVSAQFENETGFNPLFSFTPSADLLDSSRYSLYGSGLSTTLPTVYMLSDNPQIQALFVDFLADMLEFSGLSQDKAIEQAQSIYSFEKILAQNTMSNEQASKVENLYNPFTRDDLDKVFISSDLDKYLNDLGYGSVKNIIITDVQLVKKTGELLSDENLEALKAYVRARLVINTASFLSSDLRDAINGFNAAFLGLTSTMSDEEQAFTLLNSVMSGYLGRMYVEMYFPEAAKEDVKSIVEDIISTYGKRIENLNWMSSSTKEAAISKLNSIKVKIGFPDTWDDPLEGISMKTYEEGGSLLGNIFAITSATVKHSKTLLEKPVDKSGWMLPPQTVNAFYNASNNEIIFPAGILQAPFYDLDATREQNLGAIGTIIAHEITHAYDNNGAQFDENGNMRNWWTQEDYLTFQQKCQNVIDLYNGIEIAPNAYVNGSLTVSENVSDIGAMACILDVAKEIPNVDYAELFESNARIWRFTGTNQMYQLLSTQDVHSPGKLRSNMVVRNFQEFYDTYGIDPEDKMYLDPEKRVRVW